MCVCVCACVCVGVRVRVRVRVCLRATRLRAIDSQKSACSSIYYANWLWIDYRADLWDFSPEEADLATSLHAIKLKHKRPHKQITKDSDSRPQYSR